MAPSSNAPPAGTSGSPSKRRGLLRLFLLGLAVAAILWATWQFDRPRYLSIAGMRALVDEYAPYGPLIFIAIVVAGLFTRVPFMGTVLIALGTVLFGGLAAFAYGWLAGLIGTAAIFLFVRSVARDYVQRMLGRHSERLRALDERVARNGFRTVLVLRLLFGLAPMLNWGLGLTGVRLPHYLAATALGIVPHLTIAVFFADAIVDRLPEGGIPPLWVVVGGILLVVAIATVVLARHLRRKRGDRSTVIIGPGS